MLALRNFICFSSASVLTRGISSWQLTFNNHGEPLDVLYERNVDLVSPKNQEVLVNFRASPINPSDINAVQGVYPVKPTLPGVGGNEGAGYVLDCGPGVSKLKPGDLIIPAKPALGTWRNTVLLNESDVIPLNPKLSIEQASVINVNPSTAYLLLNKYVDLNPGDCVIQNGATSTSGIYLMQICKSMRVNSINIFRARDTAEKTESIRQALLDYGATLAVTEEELKERSDLSEFGPVRIGYDCVGGKAALTIMKYLEPSGTFVNYGGMSRQPIPVPVKYLIFKDLHIRGFWLSGRENKSDNMEKRLKMINQIAEWMIEGKIKLAPFELIPHTEWKSAMSRSVFKNETPKYLPCKYILSFPET
nr:zinc binding dehydrogenase [Hymenolepis microstoma]